MKVFKEMNKKEKLEQYLNNLDKLPYSLSPVLANATRQMWRRLEDLLGEIELPIIYPVEGKEAHFVWNSPTEYITLEFDCKGNIEWFYRKDQEVLGTDEDPVHDLPEELLEKIRNFKYEEYEK